MRAFVHKVLIAINRLHTTATTHPDVSPIIAPQGISVEPTQVSQPSIAVTFGSCTHASLQTEIQDRGFSVVDGGGSSGGALAAARSRKIRPSDRVSQLAPNAAGEGARKLQASCIGLSSTSPAL